MNKLKSNKILIVIAIIILAIFIGKIGYCCTYVGDIVVTYPLDEYTVCEKIASTIMGYEKNPTKQQLYDEGLISKDQSLFQKFNDTHYKKKEDKKAVEEDKKKKTEQAKDEGVEIAKKIQERVKNGDFTMEQYSKFDEMLMEKLKNKEITIEELNEINKKISNGEVKIEEYLK